MKSIITKLYNGELYELENSEQKELRKKLKTEESRGKMHDALWKTLSHEQQNLFREWELESGSIWEEEIEAAYLNGFKLGALLGLEIGETDFEW